MASVEEVAAGLLKNPLSKKWRAEYAKLSMPKRKEVRSIIDDEAMGTGKPGKDFMDFWKYAEDVDI